MTHEQQEMLNEIFLGKEDPDMAFKKPMTNNLKEEIREMIAYSIEYPLLHDNKWNNLIEQLATLINQKEKELLEKVEEAIGEDDQKDVDDLDEDYGYCITCGVIPEPTEGKCDCDCRNELRSEQRDRIKQLKEELNKEVL